MKRLLWLLAALAVAALAVAGWQIGAFLQRPVSVPEEGALYEVRPGAAFAAISRDLAARGIIERPRVFRWYARLKGDAARVHAGEYHIGAGTTPPALLRKLVAGEVVLHSFTIVEGWTFREMLAALTRHDAVESTIADEEDWPALLEWLGAEPDHPEGLFLPETYRFPRGTADREILRRAYALMAEALAEEWSRRDENSPVATPYEALILASIIERETARQDERARIAGVFARRLQRGMRLQTDPTVIYGIGPEFDGNLTRRDLTTPTPYNTYTRAGLPPTPIALPGRRSVHAALNPAPGAELFFVATGLPDGSHKFSETHEEHDAAVQEYLARLRERRRAAGD